MSNFLSFNVALIVCVCGGWGLLVRLVLVFWQSYSGERESWLHCL